MGRKTTNTVEYFPHLIGDGRTIRGLRRRFGNDGYAAYFLLMEMLAQAENHYLDLTDELDMQDVADDMDIESTVFIEIIEYLSGRNRIDSELWESKIIWCQKFVDNLEGVYKKRKRPLPTRPNLSQKSDNCDRNRVTVTEKPLLSQAGTEIPQSKVEYSKGKESKGEESRIHAQAFDSYSEILKMYRPHLEQFFRTSNFEYIFSQWHLSRISTDKNWNNAKAMTADLQKFLASWEKNEARDKANKKANGKPSKNETSDFWRGIDKLKID